MGAGAAEIPAGSGTLTTLTAAEQRSVPLALLGAAVVLTVLGTTAATFRGDGTAVNSFLFLEAGFSHVGAARLERVAVSITLLAAIAGVVWRRWPLFLPAAGYLLAEAVARRHVQGEAYSDWALMTHATRYVAPFALMMLLPGLSQGSRVAGRWLTAAGMWALRISLAAVFAVHGLEALQANPAFIDLIISSGINLADLRISETTARAWLEVIGVVDFVVAGALLIRPHPAVLAWTAFWAALTAFSRVTANGWGAYPDVLLRAAYYIGPIALWLLQRPAGNLQPTPQLMPVPGGAPVAPTNRT